MQASSVRWRASDVIESLAVGGLSRGCIDKLCSLEKRLD